MAHLRTLIASGWTQHAVALAAGLSIRKVRNLASGQTLSAAESAAIVALDPTSLDDGHRWTDAAHASAHVRRLISEGAAGHLIATRANVSHHTVSSLRNGRSRSITLSVARRILAVTLDQCRATRPNSGRLPGQAVALTDGPGSWTAHAACAGHPTDLWFPISRGAGRNGIDHAYLRTVGQAKAICAACPVLDECKAYIDANPQPGIWGGTTERERKAARRRGAA